MKMTKLVLVAVAFGATLAARAVTTYTVSNTNSSSMVANSLPWALDQVAQNTKITSPSGGVFRITFAPAVYGCQIPMRSSAVTLTSIQAKVVLDGTGSGVTIVDPSGASGSSSVYMFDIEISGASLIVSNLTFSISRSLVKSYGGKVEIEGCRFENCKPVNSLIRRETIGHAGYTKIERTTFIDNATSGAGDMANGSCVNVSTGRLMLNHCSFINNRSAKAGGAVYSNTTNIAAVANCSFVGNSSDIGEGEALYFDSKTRQGYLIESLFLKNYEADVFACSSSNKVGVTVVNCGYEGIATDAGDFTFIGNPVSDVSCEDVCGTATPRLVSRVVNGVRQTAPFPQPLYSGNEGAYTFQHNADWTIGAIIMRVQQGAMRTQTLWGGVLAAESMDPVDIFGTAKPASASGINPTVGAAQYYQEMPSLTVTTLEDLDCPVDNEISFREAVRYASLYADLAADGQARIVFSAALAAQAVDGSLWIPVTEGDISVGSQLTVDTLVVAPPEGLRLDFCGKTNGTVRVAAGRLFKLEENAKLELRDADVRNFQPIDGGGGALYLTGGNSVVVSNVCFTWNGVRGAGPSGGLYTDQGEAGGAIYAGPGTTLKVYGSAFDNNTAGRCGGAVCLAESSETAYAHFERTTFYSNKTQSKSDDEGGAVYAGGGRVVFVNTSFHKNKGHTAALQVRPGADVTMINAFVTESELVLNDNEEDEHGAAIYVENDEKAVFRIVNSVVGGYRSQTDRDKGYCQLRILMSAPKFFVNSIVSANNDIWLPFGQEKTFVEYTEDELRDYVFGIIIANPVVHGVTHRFLTPKVGGALSGAGMEIRHNPSWSVIKACYGYTGARLTPQVVVNVHGSPSLPLPSAAYALNTDLTDQNWSDVLDCPMNQRAIGPIWGTNAAQARLNLDFRAQMTDGGWQITLPNETHLKYLPPICGGRFVESVKLAADVSAFDPLCVKSARTVREYAVEEGNAAFKAAGGALYSADGRTFVALPPDYRLGVILVEAGVETVASNAIAVLSQDVQYGGCGLTVELPESVTTLEDGAFAGIVNVYLYFRGMAAPACTDAVFSESENIQVYVPYGSKGWDGNPNSTALPESWHGEGVGIYHWSPTEWPSLQVTTLEDVEDATDGLISLREAIGYAARYSSLFENDRAEITFAPGLPVDEETGKMEIELTLGELLLVDEGVLGGRTLVVAVPDGQMLALVGSSAAQAHRRCLYVGDYTRLELRNTEIRQFDCTGDELYGGAVFLDWGSGFVASNCWFRMNGPASSVPLSSSTEGGAVFVSCCSDARFYDCSFSDNKAAAGAAVSLQDADFDIAPFALFERTSFAHNRAYSTDTTANWGGAVDVGVFARVVFDTCSLVANVGHVSDVNVRNQADVTLVNTSVSDSVSECANHDTTGTAIQVYERMGTSLRVVNSVIGGHWDAVGRAKNYRQIRGFVDADSEETEWLWSIEIINSIVSDETGSTRSGGWNEYTEDDFTNYVYDVTAENADARAYTICRRGNFDAPKYIRPLGRESVLYGTGVTICHDADWNNVAWRYGDEELVALFGVAEEATIPVTRDILGNDWVETLGLSARQRNIGPLGAWDLAGDFESAACAIPDYRRVLLDGDDWTEVCRIVPPSGRKFLPPVCGGAVVKEVEVDAAVTSVDPGWVVSAPEVSGYVAVGNPVYSSMGGCLYANTPGGKVFVAAPATCLSKDVCVSSGTCGIGADAFRYTRWLTGVTLPASLRYIESGAFANCSYEIYMTAMSAPIYAPTSFLGADTFNSVHVPYGSTGWDGDPEDSALPLQWPTDTGSDALGIVNYAPGDRPLTGYAAWAAAQGLTGANAEWNAKPARWGGKWANAFVYTFGEGIVDGTAILLNIALDAAGDPILTTAPVVEGCDDFTFRVIGVLTLEDWSEPVFLERNGNDWTLPAGESAQFFRVQLSE